MLRILCLVLILLYPSTSFAIVKDLSANFSYYAEDETLPLILTQLARSQGYNAFFSPGVDGKISGRFDDMRGSEFLKAMQAAFGVNYYRQGDTLYFYHESEKQRVFITPRAMSADRLFNMLKNSDIFSPDLTPRMASDGSMIIVSGPPSYIEQISNASAVFEQNQTSNLIMEVFPLKYASAEDITLTSLDQTITVPGIASILRSMITGDSDGTSIVQQVSTVPGMQGLNGQGLAAQGKTPLTQTQASHPIQQSTAINIIADARVNAVIVNDAAYRMPYYKKVIADLDKPVELVEIHAAIVDVNSNFNRDLGFNFQGVESQNDGHSTTSVGGEISGAPRSFTPLPEIGNITTGGLGLSTIYTLGSDYFLARIEALQTDGNARVLGRPSVLTVDNIQASLENTSTYYIQVAGNESVDLFKVEAGTVLRVTPHIIYNDDGTKAIKLAVNVQDNQNNNTSPDTQSVGALPPIRQTKINTQAIVGEGQSLLIGGYYYEQEIDAESGVPYIKNIPLLGHLFKTTSKTAQQMERLILLTPRIINAHDLKSNVPSHVDTPTFHRSPTQNNYEARTPPVERGGGCSKKSTTHAAEAAK